jgi:hypothetical protein
MLENPCHAEVTRPNANPVVHCLPCCHRSFLSSALPSGAFRCSEAVNHVRRSTHIHSFLPLGGNSSSKQEGFTAFQNAFGFGLQVPEAGTEAYFTFCNACGIFPGLRAENKGVLLLFYKFFYTFYNALNLK